MATIPLPRGWVCGRKTQVEWKAARGPRRAPPATGSPGWGRGRRSKPDSRAQGQGVGSASSPRNVTRRRSRRPVRRGSADDYERLRYTA